MCFYSYWLEAAHHCPKVEEGLLCMSLYIILYISCISCLNLWKASLKSDVFSCPHAEYCTAPNVFLRIGSKSLSSLTKKKTKHWMTRIESALVINFTDLWSLVRLSVWSPLVLTQFLHFLCICMLITCFMEAFVYALYAFSSCSTTVLVLTSEAKRCCVASSYSRWW